MDGILVNGNIFTTQGIFLSTYSKLHKIMDLFYVFSVHK